MHIYVDADACPVIHLNKKARQLRTRII